MIQTSMSLLEQLRTTPDEAAWRRLDDLYRPFIRSWLSRDPSLRDEVEDLVQEVLAVVIRELPTFQRERPGSFRHWLRTITSNRLEAFRKARHRRPHALAKHFDDSILAQLEDANSALSRQWDQEHNDFVVGRLLKWIEPQFKPVTVQAFVRVVFHGEKPADVAKELGISVNAVRVAKSHVAQRLRQEGKDLID
jgi:RNA polymerase sigma-70 factor (ECF subfamily)